MTKAGIIESIENIKHRHLDQMQKIQAQLNGKHIENPTAVSKVECECGLWFYKNEEMIKDILGLQLFERLDKHHTQWHIDYSSIYEILFKNEKKSLFAKILGSSKEDVMKLDKAKYYFIELQKDTEAILSVADIAIRRVKALSDKKFT